MSKVQRLKELVQRVNDVPWMQKTAIAEKALVQAIEVIDDQEDRLSKVYQFIEGEWSEMAEEFEQMKDRLYSLEMEGRSGE